MGITINYVELDSMVFVISGENNKQIVNRVFDTMFQYIYGN